MRNIVNIFEAESGEPSGAGDAYATARKQVRKKSPEASEEDHMTTAEYFATPETLIPQELIFGTIRVADAPFVSHQRLVLRLATALQAHADETYEIGRAS